MDTLRGNFDSGNPADDSQDWDALHDAREAGSVRELPPEAIGQDERRMQVRAYNHWASLLGDAAFPSIEDLEPHNLTDFGPNSVLLDFSTGIDDPVVQFLGDKLAEECGAEGRIDRLSDVPPRSLLSRITDHYMQILANQAPIGFEAEFVNRHGSSILYRGILLPFSSDCETIDFIYGVINWKEMADAAAADELLLEIGQAIRIDDDEDIEDEDEPHKHHADALIEWADSPAQEHDTVVSSVPASFDAPLELGARDEVIAEDDKVASLAVPDFDEDEDDSIPLPDFGQFGLDDPEYDEYGDEIDEEYEEEEEAGSRYSFASLTDYIEAPAKKAIDLDADRFDPADYRIDEPAPLATWDDPIDDALFGDSASERGEEPLELVTVSEDFAHDPQIADAALDAIATELAHNANLYDCLAAARELAQSARASEDRSRHALYEAVGRAYDFSLAAEVEPEAYQELIEDSGLTVQDRAPMTPIVKLVFGHDYDKTRLTEYAAVLSHAHRIGLERGSLAEYLRTAEGGLKGVVGAERRLRREESGHEVEPEGDVRAALAKKLRALDELLFEALSGDGPEFSLVMVRRDGNGKVALIGEIVDDVALIERAGKRLVR